MGETTGITWTDHTFNPWWGCQRVSPGCENCYAEAWDHRVGGSHWGPTQGRRTFGDKHWNEPLRWHRQALADGRRRLVFCASMADIFEDRRDLDAQRDRLWHLIEATPALSWQLLTKRPQNVRAMVPPAWLEAWPESVWLGTTAEDQERAGERIPHLLNVSAHVRFVSFEPAIGPVDFRRIRLAPSKADALGPQPVDPVLEVDALAGTFTTRLGLEYRSELGRLDWVIVGGESGPGARPFNLRWASDTIRQCKAAGVACFVKQLGARPYESGSWPAPWAISDSHGGDPAEWPECLRVREFPA